MERKTKKKHGQVGLMDQMNENAINRGVHGVKGVKRAGDQAIQLKPQPKKTRNALGDITNRSKAATDATKKAIKAKLSKKKQEVVIPRITTGPVSNSQQDRSDTSWDVIELSQPSSQLSQPSSDVSQDSSSSLSSDKSIEESVDELTIKDDKPAHKDIDAEEKDPFMVSTYAKQIFLYYKEREVKMAIRDYIMTQTDLTANMRAILVDWLVEVQENFELNHETLYLAVKIMDKYLSTTNIERDQLQLLGSTSMFIACKFDERMPPVLDDFVYICDDAYSKEELREWERNILKAIGFDLGYPLSYTFLRRYAKCGGCDLETLTLSRFILETSLMEYSYVSMRDSQLAAAALFLAMAMKDEQNEVDWNGTLQFYTGYTAGDLMSLVASLNDIISSPPNKQLRTIRTKYSHHVFHEVAKIAPLTNETVAKLTVEHSS